MSGSVWRMVWPVEPRCRVVFPFDSLGHVTRHHKGHPLTVPHHAWLKTSSVTYIKACLILCRLSRPRSTGTGPTRHPTAVGGRGYVRTAGARRGTAPMRPDPHAARTARQPTGKREIMINQKLHVCCGDYMYFVGAAMRLSVPLDDSPSPG